jgi:hypothetical protein
MDDSGLLDGIPTALLVFFVVVFALVVAGFVLTGYVFVRNRRALREVGLDPFTAGAQLTGKLMGSPLLAPAKTLEQRLAELDDLHARGVISDAEHTSGRAAALAEG